MSLSFYSLAMHGTTNGAGERIMMANADRRAFGSSFSAKATLLAAGLLILLGTVLQLGVLGYAHVRSSRWFFSLIAESVWNLLAMHANGLGLGPFMRSWPLMLVGLGLGILMLRVERL
jgi:hypothetical protein